MYQAGISHVNITAKIRTAAEIKIKIIKWRGLEKL